MDRRYADALIPAAVTVGITLLLAALLAHAAVQLVARLSF